MGANDFSAMPKEGPHIQGEENIYQIGDAINLTCTSGKSYPPAKLRWFINNQEVSSRNYGTISFLYVENEPASCSKGR